MTEKQASGSWRAAVLLAANVLVGVLTPLAISWVGEASFSLAEGTIIGMLTTLGLTAGELLFKVEEIHSLRRGEISLWNIRAGIDELLLQIRSGLHALASDQSLRDTFYLDHYGRELALLSSRIDNAIVRKEVLIDRHHIESTHVLLSIYQNVAHDEFRAVAPLQYITDEFDVTFSIYFHAWLELLQSGNVTRLRRLFVYNDVSEFQNQNARKLLAFHNGKTKGLEARVVSSREFYRFKEDFHITDGADDIGVFSNMYLYLGRTRRGADISGSFSRDVRLIASYTGFFDALWSSSAARPVTDFVTEVVTEEQLFMKSYALVSPSPAPELPGPKD